MSWCVVFDVDIEYKNQKDKEKINKILDGTWLPTAKEGMNGEGLYSCYGDFDDHFPCDYEIPLIEIEKYVLEGEIYCRDEENFDYWKIELNSDTDYKWVERWGYIKYDPISKGRILNMKGE